VRGHSTWEVLEANRCSEKVGSAERDWDGRELEIKKYHLPLLCETQNWGLGMGSRSRAEVDQDH
jgi:hypothetical protein